MIDPADRARLARALAPLDLLALEARASGRVVEFEARLDTGPIRPTAPAAAWTEAVRATSARPPRDGEGPVDGVLVRLAREALPRTWEFLGGLWSVLDLVEREDGRLRLHLNSSRDPDSLAASFPGIDRLVSRLGRLGSLEATIAPAGGLPVDRLVLRTEDAWLEWSADLDPSRATEPRDWRVGARAELRAGSLVVPIEDLRLEVQGRPGLDSLALSVEAPGPLVRGVAEIDWRTIEGRHVLSASGRVEVAGPPLVREGILAAWRLFRTGANETSSELERYARTLLDRLVADATS